METIASDTRVNRLFKANPTFEQLMDLPYELQREVVVKMPYPDVLRFCTTSKEAKKVYDDDYFWKLKVAHDFPKKDDGEDYGGMWHDMYKTYWKELQEKFLSKARNGHMKCVESLLQLGVDPNTLGKWEQTALMGASRNGYMDIVVLLLEHGADPNIQDEDGTALSRASWNELTDIVALLLEHGADPNLADEYGVTPLIGASWNTDTDIIRLLLEHGAKLDLQEEEEKETALMRASSSGRGVNIVRLLLKHGADPDIQNINGKTALDLAILGAHPLAVELLSTS
uniref:F-box domain and ankyrin repeat protein n=1 Tax=Pithovirus LCPAC304 TaxID=2506594 RepID=A0A481Z875_9VIRU|nr:MAG: F-box domain and ankyrin repeat protein [Pithovirus LCPAC304]